MSSSSATLKFTHEAASPSHVTSPGRLARWGASLWRTLESVGRSRARRELLLLADQWQSNRPDLAAQLRAAAQDPV